MEKNVTKCNFFEVKVYNITKIVVSLQRFLKNEYK